MRKKPGSPAGTRWTAAISNHSKGRSVATRPTWVGFTRVSIGPAIKVMVRGVAGSPDSAISETAASTGTLGWQTATTCTSEPMPWMKRWTRSM